MHGGETQSRKQYQHNGPHMGGELPECSLVNADQFVHGRGKLGFELHLDKGSSPMETMYYSK